MLIYYLLFSHHVYSNFYWNFFFSHCPYLYLEPLSLFFFYTGNAYSKYEHDAHVTHIPEVFFCILILNMYEDISRIISIIEI